jgi:hypothetical protein
MNSGLIRVNDRIISVPIVVGNGTSAFTSAPITAGVKLFLDPYPYLKGLHIKGISFGQNPNLSSSPTEIQYNCVLTLIDSRKDIKLYQYPLSDLWNNTNYVGVTRSSWRLRYFSIEGVDTQSSYIQFTSNATASGRAPVGFLYFYT